MPESAPSTRWSSLILPFVWLLSAIYVGHYLNSRWVPADEGTLGQSAERVLGGELPHLDFHDPYTGGLAFVDAAIFRFFGINLFWLRVFLFACFLVWAPAVYALAREFLSPWPAAASTLIAVGWSVPNYTAAVPSWFNLFFVTFGTLALAKYIRKSASHWLILAGLCGGCSFLFKSVALYYLAGALLFFVYREQLLARNQNAVPRRTHLYLAFLILCLSIFILALIKLVFAIGELPEYLHFVFPGLAIALLLVYGERTPSSVSDLSRFRALLSMAVPFLLAAILPILLFSMPYWRHGAVPSLINGVFVAPFRRVLAIRVPPNGLLFEYPAAVSALFIVQGAKLRGQPRRILSILLACFAAFALVASRSNDFAYIVGLTSALGAIPVLAVAAVLILSAQRRAQKSSGASDQQLALLLFITALFSLIQFPYSTPGYFWYVSPLVVLLAAALLSRFSHPPRVILSAAGGFYLLFPVLVIRPQFIGAHARPDLSNSPLQLPRAGGIRVTEKSAAEYMELIPFVKGLAGDHPILAAPDCPEIYFLSGIKNPTPVFYDSLEDPGSYQHAITTLLDRPNFLKVAVINDAASVAVYHTQLLHLLAKSRFPNSRKIGSFTVYWRH
jgi:hypothetical protein